MSSKLDIINLFKIPLKSDIRGINELNLITGKLNHKT